MILDKFSQSEDAAVTKGPKQDSRNWLRSPIQMYLTEENLIIFFINNYII
jgi:hypothetical protein